MSALLLAVLLAAEPATDTPKIEVQRLEAGVPAPYSGVLLSEVAAVQQAQRITGCEAERDELRKGSGPSWLPLLIAAAVGAVAGGVTVGVIAAVRK